MKRVITIYDEKVREACAKQRTRWLIVHQLANQIDAAWKRERVGNAAAIRRACSNLCHAALSVLVDYGNANEHLRKLGFYMDMANAALAAPARNCDTTEHANEIAKRFKSEICDQYENSYEDPRTQCKGNCMECVVEWMTAEKGGAE